MAGRYELKVELEIDPLGRGYGNMDDAAAVLSLNAKDRSRIVALDTRELLEWGAQGRRLWKIGDAAANHASIDIRNLCMASVALIRRDEAQLDMSNPLHQGFVDAMVSAGVLIAEDRETLVSMATRLISRAAEIDLASVTEGDVERARAE